MHNTKNIDSVPITTSNLCTHIDPNININIINIMCTSKQKKLININVNGLGELDQHLQQTVSCPCSVSYDFCNRTALHIHRKDAPICKCRWEFLSCCTISRGEKPQKSSNGIRQSRAGKVSKRFTVANTHFLGTVDT